VKPLPADSFYFPSHIEEDRSAHLSCNVPYDTPLLQKLVERLAPLATSLVGPLVPEKMGLMLMAKLLGDESQDTTLPSLANLFTKAYDAIDEDPVLNRVSRDHFFSFARRNPRSAHYYYSLPKRTPAKLAPIVLLHGYGGNFLWYLWALRVGIPDRVILLPSWGLHWAQGSLSNRLQRIAETLQDFQQRAGLELQTPWLFGVSAGGNGAFEMVDRTHGCPDGFRGIVSIASAPWGQSLKKKYPLYMVNGTEDESFPIDEMRCRFHQLQTRGADGEFREIHGDHYFILDKTRSVFRPIRKFLSDRE
jgi:predicted esterase